MSDRTAAETPRERHVEAMTAGLPAEFSDYAREALIITDAAPTAREVRIVWANRAAAALTGFDREALASRTIAALFGPETDPADRRALDAALSAERRFEGRLAATHADGGSRRIDLSLQPIEENGQVRWWSWSQRDVTEESAVEAARLTLLAKLESTSLRNAMLLAQAHEALAAKSGFMASVSHELRTPLNGVLGMATLLRKTELSARQARIASAIEHSARHLFFLITDVLEFSRTSDAPADLVTTAVDLGQLVQDMATHFEAEAEEKGIALSARLTANDPIVLETDASRLRQVLFNLISNAVKYTAQGSVEVIAARDGADAVIDIIDTGIGIEPEHQHAIFEEYARSPGALASGVNGVGIGLSVTIKLVEALGARLNFCSAPGEGAHFRIRLPSAASA